MSTPTNRWKLGLFVITTVLLGLVVAVWVGARTLHKDTVRYVSYFDEAVSGLVVGASVSFRGVSIGSVSTIDVAPDRRHVEIGYDLNVQDIERLGLATKHGLRTKFRVPPDIRVQLATTGITGNKYVKLDFFNPQTNPAPRLPFPVPTNYIPATSSTMKNLEDAMLRAVDALPEITDQIQLVLADVRSVTSAVHEQHLPERAAAVLEGAEQVMTTLHHELDSAKVPELSADARTALRSLDGTLQQLNGVMARLQGKDGLLASLQRASDSIGDIAGGARGVGTELEPTLRDLRDAAESVRLLMDAIERQPDMLVKGRTRARR